VRRSLAVRALLTSTLIVLVLSIPLAVRIRSQAAERAITFGRSDALALAPILTQKGDARIPSAIVAVAQRAIPREVSIVFADDSVLGPKEIIYDDPIKDPEAVRAARNGRSFVRDATHGKVVYEPVTRDDDSIAIVRVFVPYSQLRKGVVRSWMLLGLLGAAMVVLAALVFDRIARSLLRSVRDLAGVADSLGRGDLRTRAASTGPSEVRDVAGAMNRLADRVEELIAAERVVVADLSHRLRTPITALRAEVGTLNDPGAERRLESGLDEINRQVDQIIRDVQRPSRRGLGITVDLANVVQERVAFWTVLAEDQHRELTTSIVSGPLLVPVVQSDLEALIDALLDNVFSHTPDGTAMRVEVASSGASATVVVDDNGPGFPTGFGPERGYSTRGSTGIGLDFVRRTAESVGGHVVTLTRSGGGARVRLDLPLVVGSGPPELASGSLR
jgi:signal transduction histidine kinase